MPSPSAPSPPHPGAAASPSPGPAESHAPRPVDLGSESAVGEEDPGASLDVTMGGDEPPPPPATDAPVEPLDPGRVNLVDPQDVEYWCREFGCTEAELREAVARVGGHAAAVRQALEH